MRTTIALLLLTLILASGRLHAESAAESRFSTAFNSSVGRAPSSEEFSLWTKMAGESALFPNDSRNAVRFAFHDLLQREPTPDELAKASSRLDSGKVSLGRLWADITNGPEAQFVLEFLAVARFVPSAEVRNFWVTRSAQFPLSRGYANGNAALAAFPLNKDYAPFVDFVYQYLLGRAPSAEEMARDTVRLTQETDARHFWNQIFTGPERQAFVSNNPNCISLSAICAH